MPTDSSFINSLKVSRIDPALNLSRFSCKEEIDWYLRERARDHHQKRITNVLCWLEGPELAGYLATAMTQVELDVSSQREELGLAGITLRDGGKNMRSFPAFLIGMLGVCGRYRRRGLGEEMVKAAIGFARTASELAGCRFVAVDSDPTDSALGLYGKLGFKKIEQKKEDRATIWMYYDLGGR